MTNPPVDVVLPCLNEAAALPWVLSRMPAGYRAIVVDNGSHDGSADVARSLGAIVVDEPHRGFGAACHAGLLHATSAVVCFMDADASLDPEQLPSVVDPVTTGAADIVLGRRVAETRLAWPRHARCCECVASAPDPGAHRLAIARPRSDARSQTSAASCAWSCRSSVRLPARDGAAGSRCGVANVGGRCQLPATDRAVEGHRQSSRNCAGSP